MKPREKVMVGMGGAIVALIVIWKLLGAAMASSAGSGTLDGGILRLQEGDRLQRSVSAMVRELGVEVPTAVLVEQEAHIRGDIARKAQECKLVVINQKGVATNSRGGASKAAPMLQYRLELYGQYDSFMQFVNGLEKSPIPYVVREIQFENAPRPPAGANAEGQQGGPEGGAPPEGAQADGGPRGRNGRGGSGPGGKEPPPNGRVHVTMRVQSYLFPVDATNVRPVALTGAPASAATATTSATQRAAAATPRPASAAAPEQK